ncbi:MAG: glycoside hydrolase family 5 protein [Promethearchaeota archaeon]
MNKIRLKNALSVFIFLIFIFKVSGYLGSPVYNVIMNNSYSGFRGVNLGNFLEAPNEGDWSNGLLIQEKHFNRIKSAGFNLVRIPIRWNAHALDISPYTIDGSFFDRVDWVINQGILRNLSIIINIHHYNELMADPEGHKDRFLSLWQQVSHHYQNYSNALIFEVLNEPHDNLNNSLWNQYLKEVIGVIRQTNPARTLIIGPTNWNNLWALNDLILPQNDSNIVVTFHFYSPFEFTHQGAEWVSGSNEWLGTNWTRSQPEMDAINYEFDIAINWARVNNKSLFLGEFGAYQYAYINGRIEWTSFVRAKAESCPEMWGWAYWEFCSGFGIMDSSLSYWYIGLVGALLPDSPLIVTTTTYFSSAAPSSLPIESNTSHKSSKTSVEADHTSTSQSNISSGSTTLEILPILVLNFILTIFYTKRRTKNQRK